ncbi:radial spoke head protein 3 homolog B isoform X3 [Anoplolepis gracilipes]|uniref:radial spoke head protein 3 homolog B isoform X3 n=1 Tax=Anoplolepis gracilipes TaxID=354296 RepID=UPI003BA24288
MPAGISALAPSTDAESFEHEAKNPPAFTILQKDGLDSSLPLLHINEDDGMNAPRFTNLNNMKNAMKNDLYNCRRISKSNEHLVLANLQSNQTNPLKKKQQSKSQDNLNEERPPIIKPNVILSTEDFNEVLNAKLKKIQEQTEAEQGRRSPKKSISPQKKPFITTVRTGEFLMPPPEVAALLGIAPSGNDEELVDGCPIKSRFKPLVSLAKRPEVRHSSHNARCPAALKATVDFSLGMMNATTIATASTLDERARRFKRSEPPEQPIPFGNIMFDRRVARGSTCAPVPALIDGEQSIAARQAEARRRHLARKRAQIQACRALVARTGSPPPVPGRKHEPVQTEIFLEELAEKPDESEVATQTDYFLEKPEPPSYYPSKIGQDACTQIEPGELFDYDTEVQPILEVLVGKTIEQALIEVLEEEEIATLKEQQRRFHELHAAEKAEEQRLAEEERRRREEKDRRLKQQEENIKTQQETEERVAAAVLLTGYIAELLPAVLEGLKMSGYLLDEIKADVEEGFMPWLMKEVKKEMGNMIESREMLMEIIREILENRAQTYRQLGEEYDISKEKKVMDNLEKGGTDSNFVNYETPMMENHNVI